MKKILCFFLLFVFTLGLYAQKQAIPFTQDERDLLISLDEKVDAISLRINDVNFRIDDLNQCFDEMNQRIAGVNQRIDRMEESFFSLFKWGFGLILGAIFGLFGFTLYDRRSTLAPVRREHDRLLKALRGLGQDDDKIRQALKNAALW